MSDLFVYYFLVHIFLATSIYGYSFSKANVTQEWAIISSNSTVMNLDVFNVHNHLIYKWTTSSSKDVNLHLNSTETRHCNISVVRENNLVKELTSAILENQYILFWLQDYDGDGKKNCWRHYFVDPMTCQYDGYRVNDVYSDNIDETGISIVPYQDTFDALVRSSKLCAEDRICILRFNYKGMNIKNFTIPYNVNTLSYEVQYLQREEDVQILYTFMLANRTFHAMIFNSEYEKVLEKNINGTVRAFSTTHGRLGFCKSGLKNQLVCFFSSSNCTFTLNYESEIKMMDMTNLDSNRTIIWSIMKNNQSNVVAHYIEDCKEPNEPVILSAHANQQIIKVKNLALRNDIYCLVMFMSNYTFTTNCFSPHAE